MFFDNEGAIQMLSDQYILKEFKTRSHAFKKTLGIIFRKNKITSDVMLERHIQINKNGK